jgi:hypothetical protein
MSLCRASLTMRSINHESPPSTPRRTAHLIYYQRLQVQTLSRAGHDHQSIADLLKIALRQVSYAIHAERVTPEKRIGRLR